MGIVAGIAAGAALGGSIYQGERQRKEQKRALRSQERAQSESLAAAAAQERRADMEAKAKNRKEPDVASLLATEQRASLTGTASTLLTGASGVTKDRLRLGQTSLLGS